LHAFTSGLRAGAAMLTRIGVLGPEARLRDAVDLLRHSPQRDIPVLDGAGKPLGLLTQDALAVALHSHGADWPAIDAMRPDLPGIPADAPLEEALKLLEQGAAAVAVVERSGALAGLITAESLGQLVMLNRHAAR
jgi:CBS domain-containing protein